MVASYEDLVVILSAVHINERKNHRAKIVAGHLIVYLLKDIYDQLSEPEMQELLNASTDRLWDKYKLKRTDTSLSSKEAALKAINDEIEFLTGKFNLKS